MTDTDSISPSASWSTRSARSWKTCWNRRLVERESASGLATLSNIEHTKCGEAPAEARCHGSGGGWGLRSVLGAVDRPQVCYA